MNARQKVKRLKKELESLKTNDTGRSMWLRIDSWGMAREEPEFYYDDKCVTLVQPPVYTIYIGSMRINCQPLTEEDTLKIIYSDKLDKKLKDMEKEADIYGSYGGKNSE